MKSTRVKYKVCFFSSVLPAFPFSTTEIYFHWLPQKCQRSNLPVQYTTQPKDSDDQTFPHNYYRSSSVSNKELLKARQPQLRSLTNFSIII